MVELDGVHRPGVGLHQARAFLESRKALLGGVLRRLGYGAGEVIAYLDRIHKAEARPDGLNRHGSQHLLNRASSTAKVSKCGLAFNRTT